MEQSVAVQVNELMLEFGGRLNESVILVMKNCEEDEVRRYKHAVGKIMGEMLSSIMEPIYSEYPALAPEGLINKGAGSVVTGAKISSESILRLCISQAERHGIEGKSAICMHLTEAPAPSFPPLDAEDEIAIASDVKFTEECLARIKKYIDGLGWTLGKSSLTFSMRWGKILRQEYRFQGQNLNRDHYILFWQPNDGQIELAITSR